MPVPKFWAKASQRLRCRLSSGQFDGEITKYGWSDISEQDARSRARSLLEDLAARVADRRAWPDSYDLYCGAQPLREEILREVPLPDGRPGALLTRNRYGAVILNTHRVAFVDIDDPEPKRESLSLAKKLLRMLGLAAASAAPPRPDSTMLPETLTGFSRANPNWGLRVYRTAAGWRVLITHATFSPDDPSLLEAMVRMGADPLYVRLCKGQKVFRARLTAKPWRVGMESPVIRWPLEPESAKTHVAWLRDYEARCAQKPVCSLVTQLGGSGLVDPEIQMIQELHDRECLAAGSGSSSYPDLF
jgi:hypothetical protein